MKKALASVVVITFISVLAASTVALLSGSQDYQAMQNLTHNGMLLAY